MRVRKSGDRVRLTFKAAASIRIRRELWRQDLDRDAAIEPRVARLVDLAHAARAQGREDLVRTEPETGAEGHRAHTDYRRVTMRLRASNRRKTGEREIVRSVRLQPDPARSA